MPDASTKQRTDNFYDTEFAQKSIISKAECYKKMGEMEQAEKFFRLYLEKYPEGSKASKAKNELSEMVNNKN